MSFEAEMRRGPSVHTIRENVALLWLNRLRIKRNDFRRLRILHSLVRAAVPMTFRRMSWVEYLEAGIPDVHDRIYREGTRIKFILNTKGLLRANRTEP